MNELLRWMLHQVHFGEWANTIDERGRLTSITTGLPLAGRRRRGPFGILWRKRGPLIPPTLSDKTRGVVKLAVGIDTDYLSIVAESIVQ